MVVVVVVAVVAVVASFVAISSTPMDHLTPVVDLVRKMMFEAVMRGFDSRYYYYYYYYYFG